MVDPKTVKEAAEVVAAIVPTKQVYEDAIQPAARQVGKGLETVTKLIHIALAPLAMIIWGYEKIKDYLESALAERLKHVPPERITTPSLNVAGPAIEAMRFAAHDATLREMYANLLATAMDTATATSAHPSFVEILKQLTPDEAKIVDLLSRVPQFPVVDVRKASKTGIEYIDVMRRFSLIGPMAKCAHESMVPTYLDNLCRLGIISIPHDTYLMNDKAYDGLVNHESVKACMASIENGPDVAQINKQVAMLTILGRQFIAACVVQPERR